ncbi:MAG: methyltransferase [Candidatus Thorarchaeota archaeon]
MPLIPSFIERLVMLKLNKAPGPLLDILGAQAFRVIVTAVKLDVFETLSSDSLAAAEIALQVKADERGITMLLDALEAFGYVKKKGERYTNSAMTVKWLLGDISTSLADTLSYLEKEMLVMWGYLEECIRRGRPSTTLYEWLDQQPGSWQEFQAYMVSLAHLTADEMVAKVKLPPSARRLLDVGGGHGLYSIKFCRRYRKLTATIFDLPESLEVARKTIAAEEMGQQVSVQEGDFWADDLGTDYDMALLFNIHQAYLPDKNTELLRKVSSALNPGGLVVIMGQVAGKVSSPVAKAVVSMAGLTSALAGGQSYSFDEITHWLLAAGFTNARQINLRFPGTGLVLGTRTS